MILDVCKIALCIILFIIIIIMAYFIFFRSYNIEAMRLNVGRDIMKIPPKTRQRVFGDMTKLLYKYLGAKPLWFYYGSLLGTIRNHEIICYDDDLDLCMLNKDFDFALSATKKLVSEHPEYTYGFVDWFFIKYVLLIHKETGLPADITFFKKTRDGSLKRLVIDKVNDPIPYDTIFPLKEDYINVLGERINVLIPGKPDDVLKKFYGPNYITPDRKCNEDCSQCWKQ